MDNAAVIERMLARMEEIDVKPQTLSLQATGSKDTVRNWLRKHNEGAAFSMRHANLEAVARALRVSLTWLLTGAEDGDQQPSGFGEDTASYTPKAHESHAVRSLYSGTALKPEIGRRMQVDMPGLGIASGDLLVVDLGREARAGDLVPVTTNDGTTVIRRYFPPYLLANNAEIDNPPLMDDDQSIIIHAPIIGTIRGLHP